MICSNICLSSIEKVANEELYQLAPIDPVSLLISPFQINKPDWCAMPIGKINFYELGNNKIFDLGTRPFYIIGRSEKSNIVIEDLMVSRCHAVLLHSSCGESYIIDLGSAHGTYIGTSRLTPYTPTLIRRCSVLSFGSCNKQFIVRTYPRAEEILELSRKYEDKVDRAVLVNTYHNVVCLDVKTVQENSDSFKLDSKEIRLSIHRCETIDISDCFQDNYSLANNLKLGCLSRKRCQSYVEEFANDQPSNDHRAPSAKCPKRVSFHQTEMI